MKTIIENYVKVRQRAYDKYLKKNKLKDDFDSKSSFYCLESDSIEGQPNPDFLTAIEVVHAMVDFAPVVGCYIKVRQKAYDEYIKKNKLEDGPVSKSAFFCLERKPTNPDFLTAIEVAHAMVDFAPVVGCYIKVRQKAYDEYIKKNKLEDGPVSKSAFFCLERNPIDGKPNPVFRDAFEIAYTMMELGDNDGVQI